MRLSQTRIHFEGGFTAPENDEDWKGLAKKAKLLRKSIHDLTKMASGSRVLKKQFIMMRAIWPALSTPEELCAEIANYNLHTVWETAAQLVDGSVEFKKYFDLIDQDQAAICALTEQEPGWAGSLMPVLRYQLLCAAVPNTSNQPALGSLTARRPTRGSIGNQSEPSPIISWTKN